MNQLVADFYPSVGEQNALSGKVSGSEIEGRQWPVDPKRIGQYKYEIYNTSYQL